MTDNNKELVAIYCRRSRVEDKGIEVCAKQEFACRELAQKVGFLPYQLRVFTDEDVSGTTMIEERPGLNSMIDEITTGKYIAVIVTAEDRLARSQKVNADIFDWFTYYSLDVYTVNAGGTIDYVTPEGRAMLEVKASFNALYVRDTKRKYKRGKEISLKEGQFVGGRAPYGYQKIDKKGNGKVVHTLKIVDEKADVVRKMFELALDGSSTTSIANYLNNMGIPSPTKESKWYGSTVFHTLTNVTYIGKVSWYNIVNTKIKLPNGKTKRIEIPPDRQRVEYQGLHEAIIDESTFDAVQKMLESRPHGWKVKIHNPLASLLYCRGCCYAFTQGHRYIKNVKGETKKYFNYSHPKQIECHCKKRHINRKHILNRLSEALLETIPKQMEGMAEATENNSVEKKLEELQKAKDSLTKRKSIAQRKYNNAEYELAELQELLEAGDATKTEVEIAEQAVKDNRKDLAVISEKLDSIVMELKAINPMTKEEVEAYTITIEQAVEMLRTVEDDEDAQILNEFLRMFIKRIEYDTDTDEMFITFVGAEVEDEERENIYRRKHRKPRKEDEDEDEDEDES